MEESNTIQDTNRESIKKWKRKFRPIILAVRDKRFYRFSFTGDQVILSEDEVIHST